MTRGTDTEITPPKAPFRHNLDDYLVQSETKEKRIDLATGLAIDPAAIAEAAEQGLPGLILKYDWQPHRDHPIPTLTVREAKWRHASWRHRRFLTHQVLYAMDPRSKSLQRFCDCGAGARIKRNAETGERRYSAATCRHRMCGPCRQKASQIIQGNMLVWARDPARMKEGKRLRSVTLTMAHNCTSLKDQVKRLYNCFSLLRKDKVAKKLLHGGAAVLEIKISGRDGHWHPHLHIIAEGYFLYAHDLSDRWHAITGDSTQVYVEEIKDLANEVQHHCKYITKTADTSIYQTQERLAEYITATAGVRLVNTFGTWRGCKLSLAPKTEGTWVDDGSLVDWLKSAAQGNRVARDVLDFLKNGRIDAEREARERAPP
jgi:hypothetical protein